MRTLLAALLATAALGAIAQSTERARPPGTRPLEEPPPPPVITQADSPNEPTVTVRFEGDQRIEEHRIGGKLYMQKVTPKHGKAYVLMDHRGDGTFSRLDNTIDQNLRAPQWVLLEF